MTNLIIHADEGQQQISRHIYGHFAEHLGRCIYDGIWVGESSPIPNVRGIRSDIVAALRAVKVPVLRWPGGCYADEYHWKDGIGTRDQRPVRLNLWGNVLDSNQFGTHEFMDLCDQIGCEPYICGNVGSGSPQELAQWVEYMTYPGGSQMSELRRHNGRAEPWKVKYWGVGNENWGCGGTMEAETYAALYRQFQTFMRNYGDNQLYKIAGGVGGVDTDGSATDALLRALGTGHPKNFHTRAVSLHYYAYFVNDPTQSSTNFGEAEWFTVIQRALEIDQAIEKHIAVMDFHDPEGKLDLIVDEWGAWYPADAGTPSYELYQQNTLRDALIAAATLHIFQKHCARVKMANLAQTVNVIQALILTKGEKMLLTPTYHVFEMFKGHQDATLLPLYLESEAYTLGDKTMPALSASASRGSDGKVLLTLCNLNPNDAMQITCDLRGAALGTPTARILTANAMNTHNSFDAPNTLVPQAFTDFKLSRQTITISAPAKSVIALTV